MRVRRGQPRERGAAMVEFALVVPLLLALVFGIISYSYMLSFRGAMSQAAVEGARSAAIAPPGSSDATLEDRAAEAVTQSLAGYGGKDFNCVPPELREGNQKVGECTVELSVSCEDDSSHKCAAVEVVHRYRDHALIPSFPGLGITLPDEISFRSVVEVS